jgi:hypothetical protein
MPKPRIEVEGPFSRPWPRRAKWWLLAAVLAFMALCGSVSFTVGALLRANGVA